MVSMLEGSDLAGEYEKAFRKLKEIRGMLSDRVIKQLLLWSVRPRECTEYMVSSRLGMPRSTVRKVMQDLESEGILYTQDLVTVKPYRVRNLTVAIEKGYVSFTKEEFDKVFSVGETNESWDSHTGSPIVGDMIDGELVHRYLGPSQKDSIRELLGRFHQFEPRDSLWDLLSEAYGEKNAKRLSLMEPEYAILSDATQQYRRPPADWIPISADTDLSSLDADGARKLLRNSIEAKLSSAAKMATRFLDCVKKEGYQSFVAKLSQERGISFPKECVWAMAYSLRCGSRLGRSIGVQKELADQCEELATTMEQVVDRDRAKKKTATLAKSASGKER